MTKGSCLQDCKNRVSYVCLRSADLRYGKTLTELSQSEAMKIANEEWRKGNDPKISD